MSVSTEDFRLLIGILATMFVTFWMIWVLSGGGQR